jgi:hypothetical protein
MNRIVFTMILLCASCLLAVAQQPEQNTEVTEAQWRSVLVAVSNEDWGTAVELSSKYLKQLNEDDERLPRLRYIYMYAAAGKVSEGGMSFDELEQSLKAFSGKEVVLPYRPIAQHCKGDLNFICPAEGGKDQLIIAATNKAGTTIHAFEYVQLKESFDLASHDGEEASISGTIDSIQSNPNKSRFLVLRIYISGASVTLKKRERQKADIK